MMRLNALLLLILSFVAPTSTKAVTSPNLRAAIVEDQSVILTERLASPGVLTTVAGSQGFSEGMKVHGIAATTAVIGDTNGVAVDGAGNLFISSDSHQIFKVTASTGIFTVVAGTGQSGFSGDGALATSARLNGPQGVKLDSFGNIFVVDLMNDRIRKITVSTGIITTVAGDGSYLSTIDNVPATSTGLSAPHGLAVDTLNNIYIADSGNSRVRKVTASSGIITTVAGTGTRTSPVLGVTATSTTLYYPTGVAIDTVGDIFIADSGSDSIYKVTVGTGLLTLVAGKQFAPGYNGDNIPALTAKLYGPRDIALDSIGNIFIADLYNNRIRKITASTGIISTVAGAGAISSNFNASRIVDCQPYDGKNDNGKDATSALLCQPHGVAVDAAGNVFLCDSGHRVVRKVTYSAVMPSSAVTPAPAS